MNYIIGLLCGDVLVWAQACSSGAYLSSLTLEKFIKKFVFDHPNHACTASDRLFTLRPNRSVAQYLVEFGTLAVESGWNSLALQNSFYRGLSEQVRDALVSGTTYKTSHLRCLSILCSGGTLCCCITRLSKRLSSPVHTSILAGAVSACSLPSWVVLHG